MTKLANLMHFFCTKVMIMCMYKTDAKKTQSQKQILQLLFYRGGKSEK